MANRTQLRLGQITGSFGDSAGSIVDNLPVAATLAAIPAGSGSMVSVLSQFASAIQRVHGGAAFTTNAAGVFSHAIKPNSNGSQDIGESGTRWDNLYAQTGSFNSNITVGGNATITGDLTVNGTTTTLNTTNLAVEDRMIVVHKANLVNAGNVNGTSAIAFMSGSATAAQSTILGTVGNDILGVARMDATGGTANPNFTNLVSFRANAFQVDGASNTLSIAGSNLTMTAAQEAVITGSTGAKIGFDSGNKLEIQIGGDKLGTIEEATGNLVLSGGDGSSIQLDSPIGSFLLGGDLDTDGNNGIQVMVGAGEFNFVDIDAQNSNNPGFKFVLNDTFDNQRLEMSGTMRFMEPNNGGNFAGLKAPSIGTNYTLTLPNAVGSSGQVLKLSDGTGTLTFGDATGDLERHAYKITSVQNEDTNINFGANKTAGITALPGYQANMNVTKANSDLNKALEVFVNGQLLVSGSANNADADYTFIHSASLRFEFPLEIDDIVQVIQR